MKNFLTLPLAALLCCALLAGCGKKQTVSRLDAIKAAGKIVVYTNPEFPPMNTWVPTDKSSAPKSTWSTPSPRNWA